MPSHGKPTAMFVDPWESYFERLQQELQNEKRHEDWLAVLNKDERQRGCEDFQPHTSDYNTQSGGDALNMPYHYESNQASQHHHESDQAGAHWHDPGHKHGERPPEEQYNVNSDPNPHYSPSHNYNNVCEDHQSHETVDNHDSVSIFCHKLGYAF